MSARFVKFNRSSENDRRIAVNADRVVSVIVIKGGCKLWLDDGTSEGDFEYVLGSLDEVCAALNGEGQP